MFKKIKFLASLILLVCIFLPLSQCSGEVTDKNHVKSEEIFKNYVWLDSEKIYNNQKLGNAAYIPVVLFVMPFLVTLLNIRVPREKLRYEFLDVMLAVFILLYTALKVFAGTILTGGYMALGATLLYLLASIVESSQTLAYRWKNRHKTVGAN